LEERSLFRSRMMVEFAAVVQMLVHSIQARCLPVALGIADLFIGHFLGGLALGFQFECRQCSVLDWSFAATVVATVLFCLLAMWPENIICY